MWAKLMATQPMALCIAIEAPVSDGVITCQMDNVLQFRLQSSSGLAAACSVLPEAVPQTADAVMRF